MGLAGTDSRVCLSAHGLSVVIDCWVALDAVNTHLPGLRVGFMSQNASKHPLYNASVARYPQFAETHRTHYLQND